MRKKEKEVLKQNILRAVGIVVIVFVVLLLLSIPNPKHIETKKLDSSLYSLFDLFGLFDFLFGTDEESDDEGVFVDEDFCYDDWGNEIECKELPVGEGICYDDWGKEVECEDLYAGEGICYDGWGNEIECEEGIEEGCEEDADCGIGEMCIPPDCVPID
jgi:hypothetical protein